MWDPPNLIDLNLLIVLSPITAAIAWSMLISGHLSDL